MTNKQMDVCCWWLICLGACFFGAQSAPAVAATSADDQLAALIEEIWEHDLQNDPLFATQAGDHRYDDQLPKVSLADSRRRKQDDEQFLTRLQQIGRDDLSRAAQINYDILLRRFRENLEEFRFRSYLMPISNRSGFHIWYPEIRRQVPLVTLKDYENYIARLRGFDAYSRGYIELMREGIRQGITIPAVILEGYRDSITAHVVEETTESLMYEPFREIHSTVPAAEHNRLRDEARDAIATSVVPGYERFLKFMEAEYVPNCRGTTAASALPDGRDFYRHRVRMYTTLDQTPEEVHARGLAEVKRIRAEMEAIIREVGFEGDFDAFTEYLRKDPKFYAKSDTELLKETAYICKRMDGELPELFGKLPRMPYGVRAIPEYIAPKTTAAYYTSPTGDGTRAGFFELNTFAVESRPLYTLEALTLHESVPGHHLQIALQQELEGLPNFRKYTDFTVFIEGWALYAERLGLETGFYKDPYSDFGRLTLEMWRACRLVVDTGIHYLGWTREQAIEFLHANSALSLHDIRAEVDRYIGWPGQALAYKTGELKIRELRKLAEEELGTRFDVRGFHDVVLGSGAVPLDILEANVRAWIDQRINSVPLAPAVQSEASRATVPSSP